MSERRVFVFLAAAFAAMAGTAYGAQEFSGEQVVRAQCANCHETGVSGAPRIGDREAWIPRLKQGLDSLVRSAMRGHGAMPARGGMAQLTDGELRAAVIYLFNAQEGAGAAAAPLGSTAIQDPHRKVVAGTEIILGVASAESLRRQGGAVAALHGGVPSGSGYYHVNVSLHDAATKAQIKDARVEARVASALSGETKPLEPMAINQTTTYGNYFRLAGRQAYTVTVEVLRPGETQPIETKFDLRR